MTDTKRVKVLVGVGDLGPVGAIIDAPDDDSLQAALDAGYVVDVGDLDARDAVTEAAPEPTAPFGDPFGQDEADPEADPGA